MEFKGTRGKWEFLNTELADFHLTTVICEKEVIAHISSEKSNRVANALLISKAPEMLEKLKECIDILDVKCTDGCINKTWIDFQNGNGEDIGIEIDRFIKESKQLIKEATEL